MKTSRRVNDLTICYDYQFNDAQPAAQTLIMLHGMAASHEMWRPQIDHFQHSYHTLAITLQGHGESSADANPHNYTLANYALTVLTLMNQLTVDQAIFLGNSMGGVVAYEVYRQQPERVQMIITHGTTPKLQHRRWIVELIVFADRLMLSSLGVKGMMKLLAKQVSKDPRVQQQLIDIMGQANRQMIPHTHRALSDYDYMAVFQRTQLPVLIILGEFDRGISELVEQLRDLISQSPRAELCDFPDAGHILNMEAPDRYNQLVERAIARMKDSDGATASIDTI